MPLTELQNQIAKLLSKNRSTDSHLAGGAALHFQPNSMRYSNDLDYFHDSIERVSTAFEKDQKDLEQAGYRVVIEIKQPGYIRAQIFWDQKATKVEWAHDSEWRFLPIVQHENLGYVLHPLDLAINKVLALAGRNEPRDFLDVLHVHDHVLPLGALCWAAAGKDPGFTPLSLLDLLRRRGKFQQEDFNRLKLKQQVDLTTLKTKWMRVLDEAQEFINQRPPKEIGCLYYSKIEKKFFAPQQDNHDYITHYGQPGGVLPNVIA